MGRCWRGMSSGCCMGSRRGVDPGGSRSKLPPGIERERRQPASIGISVFQNDGSSAVALIKRADEAMYGAKESKCGFAFAQ